MPRPSGYIHGSNMIVFVGTKALGHCTSCEIQDQSETKSRAIKVLPNYSTGGQNQDTDLQPNNGEDTSLDGKWDEKSVTKRSVTINSDCLVFEGESGESYDELLEAMDACQPVKVKYAYAGEENTKYRVGMFIIDSLTRNDPADDDSSFSIALSNSGRVRIKTVQ